MEKSKPTILIVDDAQINITILNESLQSDYRVTFARNGKQGVEKALADPPDLILLDILMPEMNGLEVCKILKADSRTKDIPIIIITAECQPQDKEMAFAAGAADYIQKPYKCNFVKDKIDKLLK